VAGDARQLPAAAGRVALAVTSPPYGRSVHGQVRAEKRTGGGGVRKYDNRYSDDPANLANLASRGLDGLLAGFTRILAGCAAPLRPGGTVVVTARPWRERGELIDLPGAILAAGGAAGLVPAERCVALLAGLRGQQLIPRPSFFQLDNVRKARARGEPWHLIVHEDVLVFTNPGFPGGSRELKRRPGYLRAGSWPVASARMRETKPRGVPGGLKLIAVFPLSEPALLESRT
jgi:modification methylase